MIESAYNPCLIYSNHFVNNQTRTSICSASCLYFGYNLGSFENLLTAFLFACNTGACTIKPGLVTRKKELQKTLLVYITDIWTIKQNLPIAIFDHSCTDEIAKFLLYNDIINFIICFTNAIRIVNFIYLCKQMTTGILTVTQIYKKNIIIKIYI